MMITLYESLNTSLTTELFSNSTFEGKSQIIFGIIPLMKCTVWSMRVVASFFLISTLCGSNAR